MAASAGGPHGASRTAGRRSYAGSATAAASCMPTDASTIS